MSFFQKFSILVMVVFCQKMNSQTNIRSLSKELWQFSKKDSMNWFKAEVPGTVHTDLYRNQLIPDPYFGDNEKKIQWIELENWTYRTEFFITAQEIESENIDLYFEGLDTYAEIYLNGNQILKADNMFRIWKREVKQFLLIGKNTLTIHFESAVQKGKREASKLTYTLPEKERVFTRKAQYQYGWDWGPRFVTAGIWKDVYLKFWNKASIQGVKNELISLHDTLAKVKFKVDILSSQAQEIQIEHQARYFTFQLHQGQNQIEIDWDHKNPKRWWCHGMGSPNLYDYDFYVIKNGIRIDHKKVKVAFRTIEFMQEKDSFGKSFYFKLNGVPIFIKGANMIPPSSFIPSVTESKYDTLVGMAVQANMNMLRIWGGGIYLPDAFYDACDRRGMLVWQDFMFACAMYPGDEDFLQNVKHEVIDQVSRIQNHPSVALWCGNNESDEGWQNWGWQKQFQYTVKDSSKIWNDYSKLFHELIPNTLDSLLAKNENRYWPSSPSLGWGRKESLSHGDLHYWGVWWGREPFEMYRKKVGRFISEYGFQAMPDFKTFGSFTDSFHLKSEAVRNHQKHLTGYETIQEYMSRDYKIPSSFQDYIYVSQLLQAEGMKIAIEAHRTAKPYCMGTLYWQLNDCWPVTSWSSFDYFGRWKASHYQVKRSYENMILTVQEVKDSLKIILINDYIHNTIDGVLHVSLTDFRGEELWNKNRYIVSALNSTKTYMVIAKKDIPDSLHSSSCLSIRFTSKGHRINTENIYFFKKPKDLKLQHPKIKITRIHDTLIEIQSDVLAKNVMLSSEDDLYFSDNYFDMLPDRIYRIRTSKPMKDIKLRSLVDTY